MIQHHPHVGAMPDGRAIDAYTLANAHLRARILTLGGIITHLHVPDRDGKAGDVVLGFDCAAPYLGKQPYFGAIIGRVGNRIGQARFTLDGVEYQLAANNGANHLHGGFFGYDKRLWTAVPIDGDTPSLTLTLRDNDREENYPGNVDVMVKYTLADRTLRIDYTATTDKATPINLTNHAYFNLKDAGATSCTDHVLLIDATRYTPVDAELIPTGAMPNVVGTPFDFTKPKPIGRDLAAAGGYDHNYVLRDAPGALARIARVEEPTTGRVMETWTTEPGVQLYTGNFLDGTDVGKAGPYRKHAGFCVETQHFPDAVNQPNFPSTILRPGQTYRSTTEYRFGVRGSTSS